MLPSLGEMLEQRLGRAGYYLGTVVTVSVALFLILLPLGTVVAGAVAVSKAFYGPIPTRAAIIAVDWVVFAVLFLASLWFYRWLYRRYVRKALEQLQKVDDLLDTVESKHEEFKKDETRAIEQLENAWEEFEAHVDKHLDDHMHPHATPQQNADR